LVTAVRDQATRSAPDAIVVFIGNIQIADWIFEGASDATAIGEVGFDARYDAAGHDALAQLEATGAPVLLATLPTPAWDATAQFAPAPVPGAGPLTINDAARARRLNDRNRALLPRHPGSRLVPYAELITGPDGSISRELRPDGMHLDPDEIPALMRAGLETILRDAYREVIRANPAAARPGRTIWTT
jgi:hypothetical protein